MPSVVKEYQNQQSKKDKRNIFIIGAKSLGQYGGYETFLDKLTEVHQNESSIQYYIVKVYEVTGSVEKLIITCTNEYDENGFNYKTTVDYSNYRSNPDYYRDRVEYYYNTDNEITSMLEYYQDGSCDVCDQWGNPQSHHEAEGGNNSLPIINLTANKDVVYYYTPNPVQGDKCILTPVIQNLDVADITSYILFVSTDGNLSYHVYKSGTALPESFEFIPDFTDAVNVKFRLVVNDYTSDFGTVVVVPTTICPECECEGGNHYEGCTLGF